MPKKLKKSLYLISREQKGGYNMEKPRLIPADYLRDNPFAETHKYKIYHDGYNYVATRIVRSKGKRPPKKPAQTAFDIAFDSLYFQAKRKSLSGDEMADYIQAGLEKLYPASSTLSLSSGCLGFGSAALAGAFFFCAFCSARFCISAR